MSKFFEDKEENKEETQEEQEKIALGEEEFTSEELQELVGKAKAVKEFEEKQGQTWDEVTKSWGKRGERIGELKKQLEEYEKKKEEANKPEEQVNAEQVEAQIKAEAKKYGFVLKDDFEQEVTSLYNKLRGGERVFAKVNKTIKENVKKGYPKTDAESLLKYMNDPNNPADPGKHTNWWFKKKKEK